MSTVQLCIVGSGSLNSSSYSTNLYNTSTLVGTRSASMAFYPDGTTTGTSSSNTSNWYAPTSAGIGSYFWCRLTTSGMSFVTVGGSLASGTWTQFSSMQNVVFSNSTTSSEGTGNFTVQFATDAGGANITGTVTGSVDVGHIV